MNYKVIYENGYLVKTDPLLSNNYDERSIIYEARFIVSDGIEYDLEDICSINTMVVPDFDTINILENNTMGVTGYLDYVLRMKASELRNRKENYLSICLLKKACELMRYSTKSWQKKDYMRLVDWLYEDGRFDEADAYNETINAMFSDNTVASRHKRELEHITSLGHDLTLSSQSRGCCAECAKRRRRIYSISGSDKRFPKFTEYKCDCTGISLLLFIEGRMEPPFPTKDYVSYSNRPFVDDRTDEEKEMHQHYLDRKVYDEILERDRRNYYRLKRLMPDFPFSSFRSFRNKNNKNKIQELAEEALQHGVIILHSKEEELIIDRYLKTKKEKGWR